VEKRNLSADPGEVRKELRAIARELRAIRYRLLGVLTVLPERQDESAQADPLNPDYDAATEMRLITQCIVHDNIEPAVTALLDAVRYRTKRGEKAT
jgi:hypothetical protein